MADFIKREDAIALLSCFTETDPLGNTPRIIIEHLPAADVRPVVHGKWIVREINEHELSYGTIAYQPVYECSACGLPTESYLRYDEPIMPEDADFPRYCPNCGASMKDGDGG